MVGGAGALGAQIENRQGEFFGDALRRFEPPGEAGGLLVITCFGTVNANAGQPAPFEGRLYALLAAAGTERLTVLDRQAQAALAALPDVLEVRS